MSEVSTSRIEPHLVKRWAVRGGLVKAGPEHYDWLLADCVAPAASRNVQMVISLCAAGIVVGAAFAERLLSWTGLAISSGIFLGSVIPLWGRGDRRAQQLLRRHGLVDPPTMATGWSTARYNALNVGGLVFVLVLYVFVLTAI